MIVDQKIQLLQNMDRAITLHFDLQSSYDAVRYKFQLAAHKYTFKNQDKRYYPISKIVSTPEQAIDYFTAQRAFDALYKLQTEKSYDREKYLNHVRYQESISHYFAEEIRKKYQGRSLNTLLSPSADQYYPPIILDLMREDLSIQAAVIFNFITDFLRNIQKTSQMILWDVLCGVLQNYQKIYQKLLVSQKQNFQNSMLEILN